MLKPKGGINVKIPVTEGVWRESLATGENLMVVRFTFQAGAVVPTHRHMHEQSSYIVSGGLRYTLEGKDIVLRPRDSLVIPPNQEHSAVALEDTIDINSFSPPREDYL